MDIIERIKELRDENGLSDKDVEKGAGIANSSISQWRRGNCKPSLMNIVRLADYFEVSSDYLLGLSDRRERMDACSTHLAEDEAQILELYRGFDVKDRFRVIHYCMDIAAEKRQTMNEGKESRG